MDREFCLKTLGIMEEMKDSPSSFLGVFGNFLRYSGEFSEEETTRLNNVLIDMRNEIYRR